MEDRNLELLAQALETLHAGFRDLPPYAAGIDTGRVQAVLQEVAVRMQDNYPYQHPLYAGQMMKPPHPVARLAYSLALLINPNNHALDGGKASSQMEKEAVAEIAAMFGWPQHLGHLTSGGTFANLEALWVAGSLAPGKKVVASSQAHYTHGRITGVLRIPFRAVDCDARGRMDLDALESSLRTGEVGTVVVTMGTTATGSVDPLPEILELQAKYGFRVHADAAYGGYYVLADNLAPDARAAFDCLAQVDSIVVDPHKHGLQPYGCGCVLFRDPAVGALYKHDSPYTYFSSSELHLGEISLECSRPGASAVALWATQRLLPPVRGGAFSRELEKCRQAALALYERVAGDSRFMVPFPPELDILVWAARAESASASSARAREIFEAAEARHLYLALARLPAGFFAPAHPEVAWDQEQVACLRSCLMKPDHLEWVDEIWRIIDTAAGPTTVP